MRHRGGSVVAVGLAVRLGFLFLLTDPDAALSDAGQYVELAANLAAGRGYAMVFPQLSLHATAFRPPLYPAVLSLLFRVTGPSVLAGKLLNVVIGTAVALAVSMLVTSVAEVRAGKVAGFAVALFPPLVANDVNVLSEPLGLLILVGIWAALRADRWAIAAVLAAAEAFTRPSGQVLVLVVAAFVWARMGRAKAFAFVAIVLLLVAPWLARNQAQVGTWSFVTSDGFNAAAMYSQPAQATGAFVDPVHDERFADHRLEQFDEGAWSRAMGALGAEGLRSHPGYLVTNAARNTVATFELWPPYNQGPEREDGRNLWVRNATLPLFYAVTALGVLGLWCSRRDRTVQLLAACAASSTALSILVLSPPRLRAPLDLACCIGVGLLVRSRGRGAEAARANIEDPIVSSRQR